MSEEGTKRWWESRTVWASLLQVLVAVLLATGHLTSTGADILQSQGADVIVGLITAILGAISLHGRVTATKRVN